MFRHEHPRLTHITVLTLSVLLAFVSVGLITTLHDRATASRAAELQLSNINVMLNELSPIAFAANPALGAAPDRSRAQLTAAERSIDSQLGRLRRVHPNAGLNDLPSQLLQLYGLLDHVRGSATPDSLALGPGVDRALVRASAVIRDASSTYEREARLSLSRATLGSAAVIFFLLGGFALFYRRSWLLLATNHELLDASQAEATTDVLTGLGNRRALMDHLATVMQTSGAGRGSRWVLVLLDLDGFKSYNDSFGHPAGDSLLARLSARLTETTAGIATAYRMGGDEFCVLGEIADGDGDVVARLAATALSARGKGFDITSSYGLALLPLEASSSEDALGLADQRMYRQKSSHHVSADRRSGTRAPGTVTAARQSADVLLRVLGERDPDLEEHVDDVGRLSQQTAERIGLPDASVEAIGLAGELHDVGKAAIPDSILDKPGPLTPAEWEFMRCHTLIGARIVLAAPALEHTAALVRSSHERVDGSGYPDGLQGDQIPVGARIISICDAFDAMVMPRPYRNPLSPKQAMVELRRGAGTQFDATLVTVFEQLIDDLEHGVLAGGDDAHRSGSGHG